ncbi:pseudouridine synthase [Thiomicrorhabdus aquaedulcis]|uniref:pseudouridine synthase n=1 Tax=Thiomicrorhabdus aquaedulcis TaxID=2211106 RepID=UPI000FD7E905|nr:pseudouridine synthase [Thiomicrorhabdus aquaedulcis]
MKTRINQKISQAGLCSRRQADGLIKAGQVLVNGKPAQVGMWVGEDDVLSVHNQPLPCRPLNVYVLYHKPVGVVCTHDPAVANNWVQAVGLAQQLFAVGRLDKCSEGLMLLTNDGMAVNRILTAQNGHSKTYHVTLSAPFSDEFLHAMASGVSILNTVTLQCLVERLGATAFKIVLVQGLNLQIRRMCKALGYNVVRLQRVSIMNLHLSDLAPGAWRYATPYEQERLILDLK